MILARQFVNSTTIVKVILKSSKAKVGFESSVHIHAFQTLNLCCDNEPCCREKVLPNESY
jgi:hypothetical protein